MRLDECYRLLDVDPNASDETVRDAYRDLLKVWHPDRFAHDPSLRLKSEEKLKAINEAYETIREARAGGWSDPGSPPRGPSSRRPQDLRAAAIRRYSTWMFACVFGAIFLLLRRPTPTGLVIALVLFVVAGVLFSRMRAALKDGRPL